MSVSFWARKGNTLLNEESNLEINMSNTNAMMILQTLSFQPDEYCGDVKNDELENFILRCDLALQAIREEPSLDPGRETTIEKGETGPTFVHCGVHPGYMQERISQLRDLASFAYKHQAELSWG